MSKIHPVASFLSLGLALGLSLGGCAALDKLHGGGSSGGRAPQASRGAPTQGAAFVSQKLSYESVGRNDNAHVIFRKMGAEHSHPLSGGNPDPTWIPQWNALSSDEAAEVAIAQAAVNRTWAAAADAAFTTWWAAFSPVATEQRQKIEAIIAGKDSHYAKIAALRTLWETTAKSPAAAESYAKYLLQFQIARAAATIHEAANVEFATYPFIISLGVDTGFASHGRAVGSEAEEKIQFLFAGMKGELSPTLPALPEMEEEGNGTSVVRWPLDAATQKQLADARTNAATEGQALMSKPADIPSFDTNAAPDIEVYVNAQGDDNIANGLTSKRITAIGKNTITLSGKRNNKIPYDCREQIGHDAAGTAQLQQNCKYKKDDTAITIVLDVSVLPPGKLQIGDQVSVRGKVTEYKTTKGAINARLADVYIEAVHRGGKRIFGNG